MKRIIPALLVCVIARQVSAGDAIAMGYDYQGVWTAMTYFHSSTPKGGHHYWSATQACIFARRDLRLRANDDLARTKIIGQSDRTGYVAVAHGAVADENKGVTTIGRGKSQNEADANALKQLNERKATTDERVVYRYFSYGTDAGTKRPTSRRTKHLHAAL